MALCECGHADVEHRRAIHSMWPCTRCECHDFHLDTTDDEAAADIAKILER